MIAPKRDLFAIAIVAAAAAVVVAAVSAVASEMLLMCSSNIASDANHISNKRRLMQMKTVFNKRKL